MAATATEGLDFDVEQDKITSSTTVQENTTASGTTEYQLNVKECKEVDEDVTGITDSLVNGANVIVEGEEQNTTETATLEVTLSNGTNKAGNNHEQIVVLSDEGPISEVYDEEAEEVTVDDIDELDEAVEHLDSKLAEMRDKKYQPVTAVATEIDPVLQAQKNKRALEEIRASLEAVRITPSDSDTADTNMTIQDKVEIPREHRDVLAPTADELTEIPVTIEAKEAEVPIEVASEVLVNVKADETTEDEVPRVTNAESSGSEKEQKSSADSAVGEKLESATQDTDVKMAAKDDDAIEAGQEVAKADDEELTENDEQKKQRKRCTML